MENMRNKEWENSITQHHLTDLSNLCSMHWEWLLLLLSHTPAGCHAVYMPKHIWQWDSSW